MGGFAPVGAARNGFALRRPLTARNHAPWYETFGVKPAAKLYLPD
jgi:predicted metalloendopeptidase